MNKDPKDILKTYWGYDSFRPLQEDIIASVLSGHDTLGLMPTGGGKSITFQVPGLAIGGLTLVVTPLISLMKDQADNLSSRGIKAAAIYMGMTREEVLETYERVISQQYNFLYLSPERLQTPLFLSKLPYLNIRLLVVDEAHCISQWGYDFRPPYLQIAAFRHELNKARADVKHVPCIALTATATPDVIKDICSRLEFGKDHQVFQSSFVRENLTYTVIRTENVFETLCELLWKHSQPDSGSAIVFVRSRKRTALIAEALNGAGITSSYYHAGISAAEKQKRQEEWMNGQVPVIVATNAFGMGIDKPDVRTVIHIDLPPSPEEYFQEAGRAGRDGLPATAYLIASEKTADNLLIHTQSSYPERDRIRMVYERLAYFFQIAPGAGFNNFFDFDIYKFCSAYRLQTTEVYNSLRILTLAGYITHNEEPERWSRIMFTCSKEHLYHLEKFDDDCQRIINALLRLYTGLFADFQKFKEERIAAYTHLDQQTVYEKLLLLSRFHVLKYVPARQSPVIYYNRPRLDTSEVTIPHTVYEDRKERDVMRAEAMIKYAFEDDECRQVRLLRYFGEHDPKPCGRCDVCMNKTTSATSATPQTSHPTDTRIALRQLVMMELRNSGSVSIFELQKKTKHPELLPEVLRDMIDRGELTLNGNILTIPS